MVYTEIEATEKLYLSAGMFCQKHLLCELCAERRIAKYLRMFTERCKEVESDLANTIPYYITFTVLSDENLKERYEHLDNSFKKICEKGRDGQRGKSKKASLKDVIASVSCFEVTKKKEGWHPHIHAIMWFTDEPSQTAISKDWRKITGDSIIVDVKKMGGLQSDLMAAISYSIKPHGLSPKDAYEAYNTLKGKHLIRFKGKFHGITLSETFKDETEDKAYKKFVVAYLQNDYKIREIIEHKPKKAAISHTITHKS